MASRNSAHSAGVPASVMSPLIRTRSSGSLAWMASSSASSALQPLIAARAGPPALDAKAVALADDMDVGEMHDPPCLRAGGTLLEGGEVARLRRGGVGHAPDQGADGEIAHDQHDAVGERDTDKAPPAADLGEAAEELGAGIDEIEHEERDGADEKACRNGRGGAQFGVLVLAAALGEEVLGDLAQHFAGGGVAWLHHHRVQSPEAVLDEAEQCAPAEPAQGENEGKDENRPDADGERGDAV